VTDETPVAVILAAGGSVRMGRPKALLPLRGEPLIAAHVRALAVASDPIYVVLGAHAETIRRAIPAGAIAIVNENWETTFPADSLRQALLHADIRGACWVTPVDVPPATPDTLSRLMQAGPPAVPTSPLGEPGHPVLLDRQMVQIIREGAPPGGLRTLLKCTPRIPVEAVDVARDFDDPAAFAKWHGG